MSNLRKLSDIVTHRRHCLDFAVLFLSVFALFLYLSAEINESHLSLLFRIISALSDTALITLPLVFLRGKWKFIGAAVPLLTGLLILANILYYRNFDDLIPGSLYLNNQASDPIVIKSAISSLKPQDILIAVFSLLPFISMLLDRNSRTSRSDRRFLFWSVFIILICSWTLTIYGSARRWPLWHPDLKRSVMEIIYPAGPEDWITFYHWSNFSGYMAQVADRNAGNYKKLSDKDIHDIKSHLTIKSASSPSIRTPQHPQNLIFITVESLPSVALNRPDTGIVTPVMKKLIQDTTTVYVDRCKVLAGLGRSADGQFIYNTGLLPLRNEILVTNFAMKDYPAIAKALGIESGEIIGENRRIWSHAMTNKSFGYDHLVDDIATSWDQHHIDADSLIFAAACKQIQSIGRPFFLFITTISMHDPYDDKVVNHRLNRNSLEISESPDSKMVEYLERLHLFDRELGKFIDFLTKKGIYDNTAIVIAGDHDIKEAAKLGIGSLADDAVPLIILNSPIRGEFTSEATQLDVFPTVLDIMGVEDYRYMDVPYRGLGKSIFSQSSGSKPILPTDRDYEISEMLIRRK